MSVPKERLIGAVRMLETRQPFKEILSIFRIIGFTSKKLSVRHRIASTFAYLFFGLFMWISIVLSIFQLNETEVVNYFLFVPTVVGSILKTSKLFMSFKSIDDFFEFCDKNFSSKEFEPYLDRAIKKASLFAKVQFIVYTIFHAIGALFAVLAGWLAAPMLMIGDKDKMFWVYWILQNPGGVYSTFLLAGFNLLPICLLLIVHEYVKYMNDFLRTINESNQYEKLKLFMTIQGSFRT